MNRIGKALLLGLVFFLTVSAVAAQSTPKTQPFVLATSGGTFNGEPVTIASGGVQLTKGISVAYEYIFNPNDSSKPHVGSGVANKTFCICSILPASLKKRLLIDTTNYNLTVQAGAGVESLSNGVGLPRSRHIVGDFGVSPSYPLPGGHVQVAPMFKWILGAGRANKVMGGTINYTF